MSSNEHLFFPPGLGGGQELDFHLCLSLGQRDVIKKPPYFFFSLTDKPALEGESQDFLPDRYWY